VPHFAEVHSVDEHVARQALAMKHLFLGAAMYARVFKLDQGFLRELFDHLLDEVSIKYTEVSCPEVAATLKLSGT
jgi:hypothetical protein